MNHRAQSPQRAKGQGPSESFFGIKSLLRLGLCTLRFALCAPLLCVFCGQHSFAQNQPHQPPAPEKRIRYRIDVALDFATRKYTGRERVRWVNRGERSTGNLIFHLYSNARVPGYVPPKQADEPRLEIVEVRMADSETTLPFTLEDD